MMRILFALQALISLATAIALTVSPRLIPGSVGVPVQSSAFLLCYLIAATELSLAALSSVGFIATKETTKEGLALYSIVFHVSSGIAGVYAIATGLPKAIWANAGAHCFIALLFLVALYRSFLRRSLQAMHCQ